MSYRFTLDMDESDAYLAIAKAAAYLREQYPQVTILDAGFNDHEEVVIIDATTGNAPTVIGPVRQVANLD